jgi:predicted aspartyl protease
MRNHQSVEPEKSGSSRRLFRILALFALMFPLTFTVQVASANERQVIPFEMTDEGHLLVSLTINGRSGIDGVIDTAATYAMIDVATARSAGVAEPDAESVNVLGVSGPQIYPVVYINSMATGNTGIGDIPAALNNRPDIPGAHNILPAGAFDGDVIDFDFDEQRVLIYDGRPDSSTTRVSTRVPIEEISGLWFAEVKLNGKKGLALIDTGSSITYVNSRFANDASMRTNVEKTQTLLGATGGGVAVRVATARLFTAGRHRIPGLDLLVADPALFSHLGRSEQPTMVLGLDYLSAFRVQIDRRRKYLVLSVPTTRPRETIVRTMQTGSHINRD